MSNITNITGREILNSRGVPTVSATVEVDSGFRGTCAVPSGASSGSAEVIELRDDEGRFNGQGVQSAVNNVKNQLHNELKGVSVRDQAAVDQRMIQLDGTADKARIGANAILAVSVAAAKAAAKELGITLAEYIASHLNNGGKREHSYPIIISNLINGGAHANTSVAIQEFLVISQSNNPKAAISNLYDIQQRVKQLMQSRLHEDGLGVGHEGGFVTSGSKPEALLDLLATAIQGLNFSLGIDVAASEFFGGSDYAFENQNLSSDEMANRLLGFANTYPLEYIEDPFVEDDMSAHAKFRSKSPAPVIGDDLTTTNPKRIEAAADSNCIDGVIIKPNQIGTLTETLAAVTEARKYSLDCYASHRSGETNDDFIVDLAVGVGCKGIKAGGLQRGERVSKYNRLLYLYENQ